MPAISDEMGSKLFSIFEMVAREMLRSRLRNSEQAREEHKRADAARKDIEKASDFNWTTTGFKSRAGAELMLRDLKKLEPEAFELARVEGHYLIHPNNKEFKKLIKQVSKDHSLVADMLDSREENPYITSVDEGDVTKIIVGQEHNYRDALNAQYFATVLNDDDVAAHVENNAIVIPKSDLKAAEAILERENQALLGMGPEKAEGILRAKFQDVLGVKFDKNMKVIQPERDEKTQDAAEKSGPEQTAEIESEELAEKTVEAPVAGEDADARLSRETRKAELHEDIANVKTTADCVQARPDANNTDISTPYADGQDAPGTGDIDADGIQDSAEDRDGDGTPDEMDADRAPGGGEPVEWDGKSEVIDDDPDYEPVSMEERDCDQLIAEKTSEAKFVESREASRGDKDVSLQTETR